jgi:hypothetical protein
MPRGAFQPKLEMAIRHHRQNELDQAERLYRLVLGKDRSNAVALHLLSALFLDQNRNDETVRLLGAVSSAARGAAVDVAAMVRRG